MILGILKAVILGIVEGVTEFLPALVVGAFLGDLIEKKLFSILYFILR